MQKIMNDYAAWRDLGPGGLPANLGGWLITTALRPFARRDRLTVDGASDAGLHWMLEQRPGPRPQIAPYPIPHRQMDSPSNSAMIERLNRAVQSEAFEDSAFHLSQSRFERRGDAIYLTDLSTATPRIARTKGEVLHVHDSEGSLHAVLAPNDAQTVISAGWGELHPLAGRPLLGLPGTYVFLYAPRNSEDAALIEEIIRRALTTAVR